MKAEKKYKKSKEEENLQIQICDYLSQHGIFYFSIPNEHGEKVGRLKKMGLCGGMPDLGILHNKKIYFIEVKSKEGILKKNQKLIQPKIAELGFDVITVYSFSEAVLFLHGKEIIYV